MINWNWKEFINELELIVGGLDILKTQCFDFHSGFNEKLNLQNKLQHPVIISFSAIYNYANICYEFINQYLQLSKSDQVEIENIDQYIDEVVQRCIELTKIMFIGSMSAMEFGVREVIKLFPNHEIYESIERKEKLIHEFDKVFDTLNNESKDKLRKFRKKFKNVPIFDSFQYIINKSKSLNLLTKEEAELWKTIIDLRNSAVHNGMYAIKDLSIDSENLKFHFLKNTGIKEDMDFFVYLCVNAVDMKCIWLQRLFEIE
ncbi:hypothetical protein DENIS_3714 [Desulfonema ishimotonii]|uniref:RiboL-PSP-HEPN domain-containing protein n=1 Tax=Desulfonema ishimotonii TaxID=45657 RepID=A0A401G0L0_9BACT|nr:hypothetical protein [Desulfonema ishimotonii]GBC62737.1 hypothetical protein DENIS_3714 [Desulfonema ishimotonii]